MAKYAQGILGPVSGKVGTVVGSSWKGIKYLRGKGSPSRKDPSPKQDIQRLKFTTAAQFLRPLSALLEKTFAGGSATGFNNAMSSVLKRSLTGTYPDITIDYSLVLVSRGSLPNADAPSAVQNGNNIDVSWTSNAGTGKAANTDTSVLAVYCPDKQNWVYLLAGPARNNGSATVDVSGLKGDLHTYLAFISADGLDVSDSVYLGMITV